MADFAQNLRENTGQLFLFGIIGMFLILLLFGQALSDENITIDLTMTLFLIFMGMIIWLLGFTLVQISKKELEVGEWAVIILAGAAIIALFIAFPGLVPTQFQGAVTQIQSSVGFAG